ncbi:MAG: anion permease [Candidatus Methanomethylicus sp.]|nr:anion permease [Candidatus Methanomethylicus sp.]
MKKVEIQKIIGYILIVACVGIVSFYGGNLNPRQLLSVVVFSSFVAGSLFYWPFRNAFALIGITLLLGLNILDVEHLLRFAQLDIILFLIGMMTIIAFLEEKKFFDWLINILIKPFTNKPTIMIAILFLLGTIMAALVDEVTSILFMSVITIKILKCYNITGAKVLPFIMFLVFTTNIGSSALPVGNPIGVLIAFQAGFTINEFIRWMLPLALIASVATILMGLTYLRRATNFHKNTICMDSIESIKMNRDIQIALIAFIAVIAGLVLHARIEEALNLTKNTMLLGVPLIVAGCVLMVSRSNAQALVSKVDWWTLLYFMLLFASVGTLSYTGVTTRLAEIIMGSVSGLFGTMLLVGITISLLTAFMDNVLAVATIAPVVQALGASGIPSEPIWWIMLVGGTYCGNATIIGSTANIVAAGCMEKQGFGSFSQWGWIKLGVIVSVVTFLISFALLAFQFGAF